MHVKWKLLKLHFWDKFFIAKCNGMKIPLAKYAKLI
nr:MAG TPA: hypothetical protein [Microviridae sp.]